MALLQRGTPILPAHLQSREDAAMLDRLVYKIAFAASSAFVLVMMFS